MEFNFPLCHGSGIAPLLKHGSKPCIDLITRLCTYDPDTRLTAKQALRHPYFKDIRDAERQAKALMTSPSLSGEKALPDTRSQHAAGQQRHAPAPGYAASRAPSHAPSHQAAHGAGHKAGQRYGDPVAKNRNRHIKNQSLIPSLYGSSGGNASSNHFLPTLHPKAGYQASSHLPSAMHSGYNSSKSTAHGTFLPSLYRDKVSAKHALYPGILSKQHHMAPPSHKPHPSHLPAITKNRTGAG